jgi:hypothetical protein
MDDFIALNPAQTILEAVQLASEVDLVSLRQLVTTYPDVLSVDRTLRIILTFLPESKDPASYTDFLRALSAGSLEKETDYSGPIHSVFSSREAHSRVRRLHLLPLADPSYPEEPSADPLTLFLLHRARRIDVEIGSLPLVSQLIEPFLGHSEHIRTWAIATLLPLLRFNYAYYPHDGLDFSLASFESSSEKAAINSLLSEAGRREGHKANIGRDIRGLVGPWMYGNNRRKRRKRRHAESETNRAYLSTVATVTEEDTVGRSSDGWNHVNDWLLTIAVRDYPRAVAAALQWNGPLDIDYGGWDEGGSRAEDLRVETDHYAQACLAMVYASSHWSPEILQCSYLVIQKVAKLINKCTIPELCIEHANDLGDLPSDYLQSLSQANFLSNSLLRSDNLLTIPSKASLQFCHLLLLSNSILENSGYETSCKRLAELSLFGDEAEQMAEFRKFSHMLLTKPGNRDQWVEIRKQVLWLRDWGTPAGSPDQRNSGHTHGVFCRVGVVDMELEIFKVLLSASRTSPLRVLDFHCWIGERNIELMFLVPNRL